MDKVTLSEKFDAISDHWNPRVAGVLNGQHVKLVKVLGEFVWHHHDDADELFYVVKGQLTLRFREQEIVLSPGEFCIVPRGVEHMPVAAEEVHLLLFEPAGTLNTGNVTNERTKSDLETI